MASMETGRQTAAPRAGSGLDQGPAREMLIDGLKNAHGLEQQAIEMLERNVERLEHYPALKARLAQHLEESRQQQSMVARCLEEIGESPSTLKDTVLGMAQNAQMMMHAAASDEVIKNSFAGYAFEHFEIAAYTALALFADRAGEARIAETARSILRQEEAMASWLEEHLPEVIDEHLALMRSGEQKH
jgi:ferritin-like metal-binding protein YciE